MLKKQNLKNDTQLGHNERDRLIKHGKKLESMKYSS